ncbi:hypothetical protein PAXRUDRAFT_53714, partial [Paxillus rubicundulus Ve08.2h10]
MQPAITKTDLPLTHDISTYVHNEFIFFIKKLKDKLQAMSFNASSVTGCVSTTTNLWSVNQTKAAFLGITAH